MKKYLLPCMVASLLATIAACSAGSASSNQTVSAQTTYSNSSLSGTYSASFISAYSSTNEIVTGENPFYTGTGTIQLSGTGSITGGTLQIYTSGSTTPCAFSASGTYSIQSTALGTANLILTSSTKGCTATDTWQLALAAADGGGAIQFARTDGNIASGSAIKQ
jgi:hypothetical protein